MYWSKCHRIYAIPIYFFRHCYLAIIIRYLTTPFHSYGPLLFVPSAVIWMTKSPILFRQSVLCHMCVPIGQCKVLYSYFKERDHKRNAKLVKQVCMSTGLCMRTCQRYNEDWRYLRYSWIVKKKCQLFFGSHLSE